MSTRSTLSLPKIIKVTQGVYHIPDDLTEIPNIRELDGVFREVTHLLALTPEEDLDQAEYQENLGWSVETANVGALKYAWQKEYLCEFDTLISTVIDTYGADYCSECISDVLDNNIERDFSVNLLTDGLYVVFAEEGAN